jgi:hypothetical protein
VVEPKRATAPPMTLPLTNPAYGWDAGLTVSPARRLR